MARGPDPAAPVEAPAGGGTRDAAPAHPSDGEDIARIMASLRCDAETARHTLNELRVLREQRAREEEKHTKGPKRARIEELQYSAEKKWIEWQRAKATQGPATDDLRAQYSALADDTTEGGRKREASMLFAAAEAHLNDDDDYVEGLKAAKESLSIYREIGDAVGEADSLRLIIHAYRLHADLARWDFTLGDGVADEAIAKAQMFASEERNKFQSKGAARGHAAMLLSMAELALEDRTVSEAKVFELGNSLVRQALAMFRDAGDSKMEARGLLLGARALRMKHRYQEATKEANGALTIFRGLGDSRNELNAMSMLADLLELNNETESAMESAQSALQLSQSLGTKKLEALQLTKIASLQMRMDKPFQALRYAREARELFLSLNYGKGWASAVESIIVDAHIALENDTRAVDEAMAGLSRCQSDGDRREEVFAQTTLAVAQLNAEETALAMKAAQAAVEVCRELSDRSWEAMASLTVAQVALFQNDPEAAQQTVQSAVAIFQEQEDPHHEAVCSILLSDIFLAKNDTEGALSAAHRGRELFKELGEVDQELVGLLMVSQAHGLRSELAKATSCAEEVIEIAQARCDRRGEALGLWLLSAWHIAEGSLGKGLETTNLMHRRCYEMRCSKMEAVALHQVSLLHMDNNEPRIAAKAAERGIKICQKESLNKTLLFMKLQAAEAWMKVVELPGASLDDKNQPRVAMAAASKALKHAKEAASFADRLGSLYLQALTCLTYSQVLLMTGASEEATSVSERSRACYGQIGDRWGEARALLVTARASFHSTGGRPKAEQSGTEALEIFKSLEDQQWQDVTMELLKLIGVDLRPVQPGAFYPAAGQAQMAPIEAAVSVAEPEKPKGLDPEMVNYTTRELAKAAIGLDDELMADSPLMDMGMDSLTVVSFRNSLQQTLGMKLPSSLVFDYPSVKQISQKVIDLSLENA